MNQSPLIIAHRGDSSHAPENTLAAFQMAIDKGADGVEFDVRLSKDGVPVVIHDANLKRTGGRGEKVADLTAFQLGTIDVGSWFNKRFPKSANSAFSNEPVPTLAAVLELLKHTTGPIYIELKCGHKNYEPLAKAVCDIIRDSPQLPQMIVKSFKLAAIPVVRLKLPEVQTAALFEPKILDLVRSKKHLITLAKEFGAHQLSLHYSLATKKFAALAKTAEMPVTIWTADNVKWVDRCRERDIKALITNDPAKLLSAREKLEI
ncbi:MAG: glycerophosphodiester phosphodiesterase family protein [Pyrinomonadaceae bacterium]